MLLHLEFCVDAGPGPQMKGEADEEYSRREFMFDRQERALGGAAREHLAWLKVNQEDWRE